MKAIVNGLSMRFKEKQLLLLGIFKLDLDLRHGHMKCFGKLRKFAECLGENYYLDLVYGPHFISVNTLKYLPLDLCEITHN